jgi:hypothetical protein
MTWLRAALLGLCLTTAVPAEADWIFGAFGGAGFTRPSTLEIDLPSRDTRVTIQPVHLAGESFQPPIYYGYRIGISPRGWKGFGLEGEFVHLKVIADTSRTAAVSGAREGSEVAQRVPIQAIVERFSISHGVNLAMVNGVYRVRGSRSGTVAGLVRAGAGPTVPHPESTIDGRSHARYELGALVVQAAAGLEIRLRGRLYAESDVKWTRTPQRVSIASGTAAIPLNTMHVTLGLNVRIGSARSRSTAPATPRRRMWPSRRCNADMTDG